MAKQEFTTEQILDALQTHKTVQKAAKALGISYPEMQKHMRQHGICAGHVMKIQNPDAEVYVHQSRGFGQSAIAEWFRNKFKKGE